MAKQATARALEADIAGRLARFFPEATPVHIPIRLSRPCAPVGMRAHNERKPPNFNGKSNPAADYAAFQLSSETARGEGTGGGEAGPEPASREQESADGIGETRNDQFVQDTVIQFGTTHEVVFVIDQPLQFGDLVEISSQDGSLHTEASVVAVQYHTGRTAVAVRFLHPVPHWNLQSWRPRLT